MLISRNVFLIFFNFFVNNNLNLDFHHCLSLVEYHISILFVEYVKLLNLGGIASVINKSC